MPSNRISCFSCRNEECLTSLTNKVCSQYIPNEACVTFFGDNNQVIYRDCYADAPSGTRELCDDSSNLECTKCSGNLCNVDVKRRGSKCFRCSGISCFTPSLADLVDCQSSCYVGLNARGEIVRDCASAITSSNSCGSQNSTCMTCTDDYCNEILYPTANRKMCIKCSGRDCDGNLDERSEFCEVLTSTESCVTIFDSSSSVRERGCSSSVVNNCTEASCLKCSFNNCNTQLSMSQNHYCVSCDSTNDPTCVNKSNSPRVRACSTNQCFSKLISQGSIRKGCGSDEECSSPSCTSCSGDLCNNILYPADRLSCLSCVGTSCSMNTTKYCNNYMSNNQSCITIYNESNQVSYRDCYSDAASGTQSICDDSTSLTCSKCTSNNCNNDIVRRGNKCYQCEGNSCFNNLNHPADVVDCTSSCYVGLNSKGETVRGCSSKFPNSTLCNANNGTCLTCVGDFCNAIAHPIANRRMCIKCSGQNCNGNLASKSDYCEIYSTTESCVTIFDSNNAVKERGCSSTVSNNCTDTSCIKCSLNNCNTQTSLNQKFYCVACDSNIDSSCVSAYANPPIKACNTNQCYSRLITNSSWSSMKKGCMSDETSACSGSSCSTCTGDLCNNIIYPSDRLSCLACVGLSCSMNTTKYCSLYNSQRQACITIFDEKNQVSYRNCYSDAAEGTKELCDDPTSLACTKCTSKNCNTDVTRRGNKCYQCEGVSCFKELNYPADIVECTSSCYVGMNSKGETVRGCADKFANSTLCDKTEDGTGNCFTCDGDNCNQIEYPMKNRLTCYKCANGCAPTENLIDHCEVGGNTERCVTAFDDNNNVIERGCSMTLQNKKYCSQNYKNCIECSGPNCNKITSKSERFCVACNSAQDPNCVLNPSSVLSTKICSSTCYTRLYSGDLIRGCLEDLQGFECTDANSCKSCNSHDKCNVENYPESRKQCFTCHDLESCKNLTSKHCVRYEREEKCVTIFTDCE